MTATTKFTPTNRLAVIAATRAGVSFVDACRHAEISPDTGKTWLQRGRREESGDYRRFVDAIEEAREAATSTPLDEPALVGILENAARHGSVRATQLLLERLDKDREAAASAFDRLDEQTDFGS